MSEALISALVALIDSRIAAHRIQQDAAASLSNSTTPQGLVGSAAINGNVGTAAPATDPFGGLSNTGMTAGTAAPAIEVTPKMIQELIIPLLSNDTAKARLSAAMQELGIPELPAARPDQLPALYAKFKAIADEVNGAAAAKPAGGVNLI